MRQNILISLATCLANFAGVASAAVEKIAPSEAIYRAMEAELKRVAALDVKGLAKPYFVQFTVQDFVGHQVSAEDGAIVSSQRNRGRQFADHVRVGSPELDNTNFMAGGGPGMGAARAAMMSGGPQSLPLEDDELAIRQAIWRAIDGKFESCVDALSRKAEYLKDRRSDDRAPDFSEAKSVQVDGPAAELDFDAPTWENHLRQLTAMRHKSDAIERVSARLIAQAANEYLLNTEGTRIRTPMSRVFLSVQAQGCSREGVRRTAERTYFGRTTAELPALASLLANVDEMVAELDKSLSAARAEDYTGPVLFDGIAAAQLFEGLLANAVVARRRPTGGQGAGGRDRGEPESRIGMLLLPKSFQVFDDPSTPAFGDQALAGHYLHDNEGVPGARIQLVNDGKLVELCRARTPLKKGDVSNGHGRRGPGGMTIPGISSLFVESSEGLSAEELKAELIDAAKGAGLDYGMRVTSLYTGMPQERMQRQVRAMRRARGGGGGGAAEAPSDPIVAYRVYVADGREEPVRGLEIGTLRPRALRRILAAGDAPIVLNSMGAGGPGMATSVIAPSVLVDEIELTSLETERENPPILKAPSQR